DTAAQLGAPGERGVDGGDRGQLLKAGELPVKGRGRGVGGQLRGKVTWRVCGVLVAMTGGTGAVEVEVQAGGRRVRAVRTAGLLVAHAVGTPMNAWPL